jgi:hypothetical protein
MDGDNTVITAKGSRPGGSCNDRGGNYHAGMEQVEMGGGYPEVADQVLLPGYFEVMSICILACDSYRMPFPRVTRSLSWCLMLLSGLLYPDRFSRRMCLHHYHLQFPDLGCFEFLGVQKGSLSMHVETSERGYLVEFLTPNNPGHSQRCLLGSKEASLILGLEGLPSL